MVEFGRHACKNTRMDWDELRYVLAIQREGTLTGAAETLGVTRTTVGRRLKEAEKRLGVRLFDRTAEGIVATIAGDELVRTATRVEAEILSAEGRILGRDAELRGRLCVSTLGFVFEGFSEVFRSFMSRYPKIELTVLVATENASLVRREADVVLRLNNDPAENLFGRRVGRMQFEAYASRELHARIGSGAALGEYPWLNWASGTEARWLDGWLAKNAAGAEVSLRTNDFGVIRKAVSGGLGVYFLPCFDGDSDHNLVRIGASLTEEARDLWLLTLPELRGNRRIRAFMDHAYEAFKAHRAALEGELGTSMRT